MSSELAVLDGATRALAEVSSAAEAWQLARDAEVARRYVQMRNLGSEAANYATGIKAKAMLLLAEFVDDGQNNGTIARRGDGGIGRPIDSPDGGIYSIPQILDSEDEPKKAHKAVEEARRTRDALGGADIDELIRDANAAGTDFGLSGLRLAAAAKRTPEPVETPPLPDGTYQAIVIDPPWPMQKIERDIHPDQGVKLAYPTMQLDELAALPVKKLAAPSGCHLYLWTTHRFLPAALDLMAEWGFRYQCVMTWRKNVGMTPFSWMYDTEHVLFGRIGNLPLERNGLRLSFDAPTTGHSIKPDAFYERVREASPGPRLDMFPGIAHPGFEPWGLEASHREN